MLFPLSYTIIILVVFCRKKAEKVFGFRLKPGSVFKIGKIRRYSSSGVRPEKAARQKRDDHILKNLLDGVRRDLASRLYFDPEYLDCISDLIQNEKVRSMRKYIQHGGITCLDHCLDVSHVSYLVCRKFGLDARSAARGALLHDFFLYDWHTENPYGFLHAFLHPRAALCNAERYFTLNPLEREIILRHMWPLTLIPPMHPEALTVSLADKYCAFLETAKGKSVRVLHFLKSHRRLEGAARIFVRFRKE